MSDTRFSYQGPARIGDFEFADVRLWENAPEEGWRSWEGQTTCADGDLPEGFLADLGGSDPLAVELPNGARGRLLIRSATPDGQGWSLELLGTGPAPGVAG